MPASNRFEERREELEDLAIAVYVELMTDSRVDPKVRKDAADSVRDALSIVPQRSSGSGTSVVVNLGEGLTRALGGVDTFQGLLKRGRNGAENVDAHRIESLPEPEGPSP